MARVRCEQTNIQHIRAAARWKAQADAMKAAPANTVCRHCGVVLDALARRRGVDFCGAAQCRHQAAQAHTAGLKQALSSAALAAARSQLQLQEAPATLVWLQHCEPQMIAVDDEDRDRHRSYLESVVADGMVIDRTRLAASTADDKHPQGARLCAQCRGRCCEHGAGWRAFIDLTVLSRWQQEHPACNLADAVDAYVTMLPAEHVRGACLYQTATGCALPRERRADICNGFACEALQRVQRVAESAPARAVLAVTFHRDQVERAAVIEADATRAIALETPTRTRTMSRPTPKHANQTEALSAQAQAPSRAADRER